MKLYLGNQLLGTFTYDGVDGDFEVTEVPLYKLTDVDDGYNVELCKDNYIAVGQSFGQTLIYPVTLLFIQVSPSGLATVHFKIAMGIPSEEYRDRLLSQISLIDKITE